MLDIPELRDILVRAVTPGSDIYGGDDATIQGALTATPWWKQHSVTQRTWTETKSNDPASAAQKIEAQKAAILVTARQSGVNIPPARLAQMAEDALSNGWTNPQLQAAIGAEFHYDPKSTTGNAAGFAQEFKRMAHDYLVPISDQAMGQWVTQAVSGTVDADSFRSYLQESAKSMFPGLASAIDSGVTVTQFADPYKQLAAKDFGVPPESIDLGENKWMKFLNQVDAKTGARTSLSIADAQQSWRSDPAYGFQYTKVAKDDAYALANTITNEMGVRK